MACSALVFLTSRAPKRLRRVEGHQLIDIAADALDLFVFGDFAGMMQGRNQSHSSTIYDSASACLTSLISCTCGSFLKPGLSVGIPVRQNRLLESFSAFS